MYQVTFPIDFKELNIGCIGIGSHVVVNSHSTVYKSCTPDVTIEKKFAVSPNQMWTVDAGYSLNWNYLRNLSAKLLAVRVSHSFISKHTKEPTSFNMIDNLVCLFKFHSIIMQNDYLQIERQIFNIVGPIHPAISGLFEMIKLETQKQFKVCASDGYYFYKTPAQAVDIKMDILKCVLACCIEFASLPKAEKEFKNEDLFRRIRIARGVTSEDQEIARQKTLIDIQANFRLNALRCLKNEKEEFVEQIEKRKDSLEIGYLYFSCKDSHFGWRHENPVLTKWKRAKIGITSSKFLYIADSSAHNLIKLEYQTTARNNKEYIVVDKLTPKIFSELQLGKSVGSIFAKIFGNETPNKLNDFQDLYLYTRKCAKTNVVVEFIVSKHKASITKI